MPTSFLIKYKQTIIATCFYLVFWGSMAAYTGYIPSGFHFQEDHEIIDGMKEIKKSGFLNTAYSQTTGELGLRFRPLYNLYRYTGFYMFGLNFSYWHILIALFLLGLSVLAFQIGRILGFSPFIALLFPLIMTTGSVSAAMVRLGTIELLGMLLSLSALFCILKSTRSSIHRIHFELLAHFCVFLACCAKEAFIPFVPIFISVKLFDDYYLHRGSIKLLVKRNIAFIICQISIITFCLMIMKTHMQKLGPIYGGFDGDIKNVIKLLSETIYSSMNFKGLIEGTGIYYIYALFGCFFLVRSKHFLSNSSAFAFLIFYGLIFIYISVSQYLIHYRVHLSEYYLLPFMFGPAIMICLLAGLISDHLGALAKFISLTLILLLIAVKTIQSYEKVKIYADEGIANKNLINLVTNSAKKPSHLLISGDELIHMEHFQALEVYFDYFSSGGIKTILQRLPADEKMFMQISGTNDLKLIPKMKTLVDRFYEKSPKIGSTPVSYFDQIVVLSYCDERFLKVNTVDSLLSGYKKQIIGKDWFQYTLYTRLNMKENTD